MASDPNFLTILKQKYPTIKVKNAEKVQATLDKMAENGVDHLNVITDFDATMSKHHHQSDPKKRLPSTFGILEQDTELLQESKDKLRANFEKYYPIEMDMTLSYEEKEKEMINWWTSSQKVMVDAKKITQNCLISAVKKSEVALRDGMDKFLGHLAEKKIPCLIFSAGCGNVIDCLLKHKEPICWTDENMFIVSNMLGFDDTGLLEKFKEPLIHTLNKNNFIARMENCPTEHSERIKEKVRGRKSVLLMGDHHGDTEMSVGVDYEDQITIGFLNYKFEENREVYLNRFDIVLEDDQTMQVPMEILEFISGKN